MRTKYDYNVVVFLGLVFDLYLAKTYFSNENFIRFWDYRDHIASVETLSLKLSQFDINGFGVHWLDSAGGGYPPTFLLPVILVGMFLKITPFMFSVILILTYTTGAAVVANKIAEILSFRKEIRLLFVVLIVTNPIHLNLLFEGFPDGAFIFFVLGAIYLGLRYSQSGHTRDFCIALVVLMSIPFIRKTYIYFSAAVVTSLTLVFLLHYFFRVSDRSSAGKINKASLVTSRGTKIITAFSGLAVLLGLPLIPSFFGWDTESLNYVFSVTPASYIYGMIEMNGSLTLLVIFLLLILMPIFISFEVNKKDAPSMVPKYVFLLSTYPIYLTIKIVLSGVSTHHILIQYSPDFALIVGLITLNYFLRNSDRLLKVISLLIILVSVLFTTNFMSDSPSQLYKALNRSPLLPAWAPPTQEVSVKSWQKLICDLLIDASTSQGVKKIGVLNSSFEINDGKFVGAFDNANCLGKNQPLERKKFNQYANSTFFDKDGVPIIQIPQIANFDRLGGELFAGYEYLDYLVVSKPEFSSFSLYKQRISYFLWNHAHEELREGRLQIFAEFQVGAAGNQQNIRITPGRASKVSGMLVLKRIKPIDPTIFKTKVLEFLNSNDFYYSAAQSRNIPLSYQGGEFKYPSATYSDWRSELSGDKSELMYNGYALKNSVLKIRVQSTCLSKLSINSNSLNEVVDLPSSKTQELNVIGEFTIRLSSPTESGSCSKVIRIF